MEIARVYLNVNMSRSFDGLSGLLKGSGFKVDAMPRGKFIIFINRKMTAFKVLVNGQFLVYHKNGNRRFPLEAIQHFPEFFDGSRIDLDSAVRKTLMTKVFTHKIKKPIV